jgi:hypothetical protein
MTSSHEKPLNGLEARNPVGSETRVTNRRGGSLHDGSNYIHNVESVPLISNVAQTCGDDEH